MNVPSALTFNGENTASEEALHFEDPPLVSKEVPLLPVDEDEVTVVSNRGALLFPEMPDLNELTLHRSARLQIKRNAKPKALFTALFSMFVLFAASCSNFSVPSSGLSTMVDRVVLHTECVN